MLMYCNHGCLCHIAWFTRKKIFLTWDSMRALNDDGTGKWKWKIGIKWGRNKSHKRKEKRKKVWVNIYFIVCSYTHTIIQLRGKIENIEIVITQQFIYLLSSIFPFFYLLFELLKIYFLLFDIIVRFFLFYADSQVTS